MSRFDDIRSFGGIDADADDLLRECFENHPAYTAALDHKRYLVVGRKGSGKTAIFRKIMSETRFDSFSYGHTFNDYPWAHHDLQAQIGVPEELRYRNSWKYLLLVSAAKIILNQDQSMPWSDESADAVSLLEDFIIDSYGSRDPDLTQLFSPNREIRIKGKVKTPFLEVSGERISIKDLPVHFQDVNAQVEEYVLESLNPDHDYYICFDQLDREFDATDPKYFQRVIGLLLAARDLNQRARESGRRLSVIVFLRDDIYQLLKFEDKNKITENHRTLLQWEAHGGLYTLKALMERRFAQVLGPGSSSSWDQVFNEEREMPSRQTKYNHICDRTFLRPRDMIKFCNEILAAHREAAGIGDLLDNASVHTARDRYSDYLLSELDDEIAKQVPQYENYLDILRGLGAVKFDLANFSAKWAQYVAKEGETAKDALRALFDFSIIGYYKSGGGGGGSKYVWKYRDPRARLAPDADQFQVHPGLKEALGLSRQ